MPTQREWFYWCLALLILFSACAMIRPLEDPDPPLIFLSTIRPSQKVCFQWPTDAAGMDCTTMDTLRRYVRGLKRAD